jgi:hypothetical protein
MHTLSMNITIWKKSVSSKAHKFLRAQSTHNHLPEM